MATKKPLKKVRRHSDKDKQALAFTLSVIITGIIFLVWLVNLVSTWGPAVEKQEEPEKEKDSILVPVSSEDDNSDTESILDIEWSTSTSTTTEGFDQ